MTKPATPVTREQAERTLAECKAPATDASSSRIRSDLAAGAINDGRTGAEIASAARVPVNVGQCVADAYEGKKPGIAERVGAYLGSLTDKFGAAASGVAENVKNEIRVGAPAVVNTVTGGAVDRIRDRVAASGRDI